MTMDQPRENPYADMAHKARLAYAQKLRLTGCTCHPHLAAAVIETSTMNWCPSLT